MYSGELMVAFTLLLTTAHAADADILETSRLRASRGGSAYGGWTFDGDGDRLDSDSIVYSTGLGTDLSFDLKLTNMYRCHVHGFNDTPVSTAFLRRQTCPANSIGTASCWATATRT